MSKFAIKFGAKVREIRKAQNMTQEQLSEKIDISIRSLGKIENGKSFPSTDTMEKLLATLKVPTAELFSFEHLQAPEDLLEESICLLKKHPDKIVNLYKVIKALVN